MLDPARSRTGRTSISPLLRLVLAQAAGILAADRGWLSSRVVVCLAVGAALAAICARRGAVRLSLACVIAFCAGAWALEVRLEQAHDTQPERPEEIDLEGRVSWVVRSTGRVELELTGLAAVEPHRPPPPKRILVRDWDAEQPTASPLRQTLPGDRLRLRARLRPPRFAANPGGPRRERALARLGVAAVGTLVHPELIARLPEAEGLRPLRRLHELRFRCAERLGALGPGGELLSALGVGERGGLSEASRTTFRRLGISHLLAVSGLHLGLVAALCFRLVHSVLATFSFLALRVCPRRAALAVTVATVFSYALLAGWGVPVRRALVLVLFLAATLGARRVARWTDALAGAALVVLGFEPQALFDPGAQLSFAVSAALLASVPRGARDSGTGSWRGRSAELLRASATATAVTAPLATLQLGTFSNWGLVANFLMIPWTALVLLPLSLLATLLGALDLAGLVSPLWILRAAERIAAVTLAVVTEAARFLPDAERARPGFSVLVVATACSLLVLRLRSTGWRLVGATGVAALVTTAPPASISPSVPRAVFLDVGQGDATLIQGRGGTVLVDGGAAWPGGGNRGRFTVAPALRALGVERLDLVVVSHGDLDHRGGIPSLLQAFPVGAVWLPRGTREHVAYAELREVARRRGTPVVERGRADGSERIGDITVTPLWPPWPNEGLSDNDRSLVLRIELAGSRLLLPGDIEIEAESQLTSSDEVLRADVLKLPHHGSRSSSSAVFLEAVDGALAVASASWQGRFGMPHASVMERAAVAGYTLWWTGRDGAVLVGLGDPLWVRGWRPIPRLAR
jgi:competence protein ComEC